MNGTGRVFRAIAALALLVGGLVHLQLYFEGYREIDKIGPSFLLNAIASGVVAAAVAVRRDAIVRLAGIGVAVGTIGAFVLSRIGDGLFEFKEEGLQPSPQGIIALLVEIATIALLAATFVPAIGSGDESSTDMRLVGATGGIVAVALIGFGAYWSNDYGDSSSVAASAPTPASISIADFAFIQPAVTVSAGTTVTWTNTDSFGHSVVAADESFTSEKLNEGDPFSYTFDAAGEFSYICGIHPSMAGTITVTG